MSLGNLDELKEIEGVIREFINNGFLLEADTLDYLSKLEKIDIGELIEVLRELKSDIYVSRWDLEKALSILKLRRFGTSVEEIGRERSGFRIEIIEPEIKRAIGDVEEFRDYMLDRYYSIAEILRRERPSFSNYQSIASMRDNGEYRIIGMVLDKIEKESDRFRYFLRVDDPTGSLLVALPNNRRGRELFDEIAPDDVLGFYGRYNARRNIFIAEDIVFPDISHRRERRKLDEDFVIAFLSDIHIGSNKFEGNKFEKFLKLLRNPPGSGKLSRFIQNLRLIVISGDLVDGVGVYPNQERELSITSIVDQYEALAEHLSGIPNDITIVLSPGNHDAVRQAEPQPRIPENLARSLYEMRNVRITTNPCWIDIEDRISILVYHGRSIDDFIANIKKLSYEDPVTVMASMLRRRHLASIYGSTPIQAQRRDELVIRRVPDILQVGHIHKFAFGFYRNVLTVCASTFQSQTEYQRNVGLVPCVGRILMLNLRDWSKMVMRL